MKFAVLKSFEKLGSDLVSRIFVGAAMALGTSAAVLAATTILQGDFGQGLLLAGVAIFSGWMASAIYQFQDRLAGMDDVVRQGRRRIEQSDLILEEMRRLARTLRASASSEEEEDRTVH